MFFGTNCFVEKVLLKQNTLNYRIKSMISHLDEKFNDSLNQEELDISNYETEASNVKRIELNEKTDIQYCGEYRREFEPTNLENKNSIIVLGCSYAYGHGLKREESFPYLLSKITNKPVISFASCGGDMVTSYNHLIEYISSSEDNKKRIENADYIVYVYMWDHINRYLSTEREDFYKYSEELFIRTKIEKEMIKIPLFRYILSTIKLREVLKYYPDTGSSSYLLKKIFLLYHDKIKEKAPKAKFMVIIYDEKIPNWHSNETIKFCSDRMKDKIWKELEKETKMEVIHTSNLTGFYFDKNYKLEEDIADWHPNAKAWKVLTPLFVEKYIN